MRLVHLLASLALVAQPVLADCRISESFTFDSSRGSVVVSVVHVDALPGVILRYRASSTINTDGSAISYNLDGTGAGALNTMCNGTNAILADGSVYSGVVTDSDKASTAYRRLDAPGRKNFGRNKCNTLLGYFSQARALGFDPAKFPRMDFYAVARDPTGRPCILPGGFLVSQTSALADPSIKDSCNPKRWLDPLRISAVVMPKKSTFVGFPGYAIDSGNLVFARAGSSFVQAVVGDKGPQRGLGEITPELGWRLNGISPDPSTLPLAQVGAQMPRAAVSSAEYFVFTQASVAYGLGSLPADPRRRAAVRIDEAAMRAAFQRIGAAAVQADLNRCAFRK